MVSHLTLFAVWSAIVCGGEYDDEDATVLLQTKIVQEHMRYNSDGAQVHKYDEVWEIPNASGCTYTAYCTGVPDCHHCSQPSAHCTDKTKAECAISNTFKTEAEAQSACKGDCQGYYSDSFQGFHYQILGRGHPSPRGRYGFGAPNSEILHVFAKDAGSDLEKLGVSKVKYDYTKGSCKPHHCSDFGSEYLNAEDAQAACNFVGAHCLGYFRRSTKPNHYWLPRFFKPTTVGYVLFGYRNQWGTAQELEHSGESPQWRFVGVGWRLIPDLVMLKVQALPASATPAEKHAAKAAKHAAKKNAKDRQSDGGWR